MLCKEELEMLGFVYPPNLHSNPHLSLQDSRIVKKLRGKHATTSIIKMFLLCKIIKKKLLTEKQLYLAINRFFDFSEHKKIKEPYMTERRFFSIVREMENKGMIKSKMPFDNPKKYIHTITPQIVTILYDSLKTETERMFFNNCLIPHLIDAGLDVYPSKTSDANNLIFDYWRIHDKILNFEEIAIKDTNSAKLYFFDSLIQELSDWFSLAFDFLVQEPLTKQAKNESKKFSSFLINTPRLPYFIRNWQAKTLFRNLIKGYDDGSLGYRVLKEGLYGKYIPHWKRIDKANDIPGKLKRKEIKPPKA